MKHKRDNSALDKDAPRPLAVKDAGKSIQIGVESTPVQTGAEKFSRAEGKTIKENSFIPSGRKTAQDLRFIKEEKVEQKPSNLKTENNIEEQMKLRLSNTDQKRKLEGKNKEELFGPSKKLVTHKESGSLDSPGSDGHDFIIKPTIEKKPFPNSARSHKSRESSINDRSPRDDEQDMPHERQDPQRNPQVDDSQSNNNSSAYQDFVAMHQDVMIQQIIMQSHAQAQARRQVAQPEEVILPVFNRGRLQDPNPRARNVPDQTKKIDVYDPTSLNKKTDPEASTKGLSAMEINSIIPMKFSRTVVKSDDPNKLECNICLVPFQDGDNLKILQCLHTFHSKCIGEWLSRKSICPECNFNLRTLDFKQLF